MAVQVYTFKVTYKHCEGKIWRIFDVSSNSDLALLGYMILASFDTMAYHLFSIECNNTIYETAIENYGEYPLLQETKLSELALKSVSIWKWFMISAVSRNLILSL